MAVVTDLTEIEITREVLGLTDDATNSKTSALILALSNEKWSAQTADNTLWIANRDDTTVINGQVTIDPKEILGRVRVRTLKRFGYDGTLNAYGEAIVFYNSSNTGLMSGGAWFGSRNSSLEY